MEEQIVPHSAHQVRAIFMDGKKRERERHDGCLKVVAGPRPDTADVLRQSSG